MPIPDFQTAMLPLLELLGDGKPRHYREAIKLLTERFQLSDEERAELIPSGKRPRFDDRIIWAKTHLKKAGLLEQPERGIIVISDQGKTVLAQKPPRITVKFLAQFPEYQEFREIQRAAKQNEPEAAPSEELSFSETPTERMDSAHGELRAALKQDLLERVRGLAPARFERLVVDLLVKMGYGGALPDAGTVTQASGDGGIDGFIKEDKLGLDVIYLQAKKWVDTVVGKPEIQKFVGALAEQRAQKGVFLTTSSFSAGAREYVRKIEQKVVLIDGDTLAELMIEYDFGVSTAQLYAVKRVDNDYFDDDIE